MAKGTRKERDAGLSTVSDTSVTGEEDPISATISTGETNFSTSDTDHESSSDEPTRKRKAQPLAKKKRSKIKKNKRKKNKRSRTEPSSDSSSDSTSPEDDWSAVVVGTRDGKSPGVNMSSLPRLVLSASNGRGQGTTGSPAAARQQEFSSAAQFIKRVETIMRVTNVRQTSWHKYIAACVPVPDVDRVSRAAEASSNWADFKSKFIGLFTRVSASTLNKSLDTLWMPGVRMTEHVSNFVTSLTEAGIDPSETGNIAINFRDQFLRSLDRWQTLRNTLAVRLADDEIHSCRSLGDLAISYAQTLVEPDAITTSRNSHHGAQSSSNDRRDGNQHRGKPANDAKQQATKPAKQSDRPINHECSYCKVNFPDKGPPRWNHPRDECRSEAYDRRRNGARAEPKSVRCDTCGLPGHVAAACSRSSTSSTGAVNTVAHRYITSSPSLTPVPTATVGTSTALHTAFDARNETESFLDSLSTATDSPVTTLTTGGTMSAETHGNSTVSRTADGNMTVLPTTDGVTPVEAHGSTTSLRSTTVGNMSAEAHGNMTVSLKSGGDAFTEKDGIAAQLQANTVPYSYVNNVITATDNMDVPEKYLGDNHDHVTEIRRVNTELSKQVSYDNLPAKRTASHGRHALRKYDPVTNRELRPPIVTTMLVADHWVEVTVDNGADVSILSETFARDCGIACAPSQRVARGYGRNATPERLAATLPEIVLNHGPTTTVSSRLYVGPLQDGVTLLLGRDLQPEFGIGSFGDQLTGDTAAHVADQLAMSDIAKKQNVAVASADDTLRSDTLRKLLSKEIATNQAIMADSSIAHPAASTAIPTDGVPFSSAITPSRRQRATRSPRSLTSGRRTRSSSAEQRPRRTAPRW